MRELLPIPSWPGQARHVIKHYYSLQERFFELGGDVRTWFKDWNALRVAGALAESAWHRVAPGTALRTTLEDGHARYLQCAEAAVAWAVRHEEVRPVRGSATLSFLGQRGVVVIAQRVGAGYQLLTCYRTVPSWSARPYRERWEERARHKVEALQHQSSVAQRAAVRRTERRALIRQGQEEPEAGQQANKEETR